jgi:curved DNA-binding protein CbpA
MLGLKQDATDQEVDRNFKALSSMYHPDKEGGDEELFKIIVSARDQIIS